jgi:hypothetical protein
MRSMLSHASWPWLIWYCGAPFAIAVAGTFAYPALTLWLPMPFALAALPALREIGKQSMQGQAAQGEGRRQAAKPEGSTRHARKA